MTHFLIINFFYPPPAPPFEGGEFVLNPKTTNRYTLNAIRYQIKNSHLGEPEMGVLTTEPEAVEEEVRDTVP
ncbi:MAG: hypothetical protein UV05_C0062G0006 [candidate division CPR1 bacterium GW2011_GWA2_42_17]|uniref:Uncharacterized protein n=1 Tax=candidate division CPR1 bacterium GW2011_GWA2_42_17 TaxID=1618341 RepID=A0A0G0YWN4_9BACT|nr:MAG: hypothetical protein UV05_C0062G0006 [candidate division CPR1 bacterium GW2011_GWA2_42_17]